VTSLRPAPSSQQASPPHSTLLSGSAQQPSDFHAVRSHLLANGRLFAQRAKAARTRIAGLASPLIRPGTTILTNGGSRCVGAVLRSAAKTQTLHNGSPRFRVIWVTAPASLGLSTHDLSATGNSDTRAAEGAATIAELRTLGVPVAEISEAAVAYVMELVDMALVGAEGVVETGGVISRLGTFQLCTLARVKGRAVYVVAESHKFVRSFPLGEMDLGVEQRVVEFRTNENENENENEQSEFRASSKASASKASASKPPPPQNAAAATGDQTPTGTPESSYFHSSPSSPARAPDAVDYTPPDLITALVTEGGVLTPSAVSEELIRIWY
jgi:translation initiation factor eIF-2B subunit alpha